MIRNGASSEHSGEPCEHGPLRTLSQQIRELRAEVTELNDAGAESLTDTLAHWLTAHYVAAAKAAAESAGAAGIDLKILRGLSADVVALRRGDHYSMRLEIERERLEHEKAASDERKEKDFWEWTRKPEIRKKLIPQSTRESQLRRVRQIIDHFMLGTPLPPEDDATETPDPAAMI